MSVLAHGEHAHLVAIFLAEQRFGAGRDRLVGRHQPRGGIGILADHGVDLGLDALQLFRRHRLGMAEIEAQPLGRHQRALLRDMRPQHTLQRGMQQMGGGVIGAGGAAAFGIHLQIHRIADSQICRDTSHDMDMQRRPASFPCRSTCPSPLAENIAPASPAWPPNSP